MSTSLRVISNLSLSKTEVLKNKDLLVEKLNSIGKTIPNSSLIKNQKKWTYEITGFNNDNLYLLKDSSPYIEFFDFSEISWFYISIYPECIILNSSLHYADLYRKFERDVFLELPFQYEELKAFRTEIYQLISVFGGSEIIYLADNDCNKLNNYLNKIEEGVGYDEIKEQMKNDGTTIVRKYDQLDSAKLDYRKITAYFFDDLVDV